MNEQTFLRLWGKTNREEKRKNPDAPHRYHPLLFHMLDVGLCAGQLWDRLPQNLQTRMATALGLTLNQARYAVMLLAGLHDLGKACPPFQHQSEPFRQQVEQAGFTFLPTVTAPSINRPHGMVSAKEIARLLDASNDALRWNADREAANILAVITGGHHGTFPTADELNGISSKTLGGDKGTIGRQWMLAREYLTQSLQSLLSDTRSLDVLHTASIKDRALVPLLAGLISVADWFGSSNHFEIAAECNCLPDVTEIEYLRQADATAEKALTAAGWRPALGPAERPAHTDFETVFAYLNREKPVTANAVQQAVAVQVSDAREPYLLIAESAMGSGKTEAALYGMDCALANGLAHGFYVALPTQATSNAMHTRVKDYFEQGDDEPEQQRKRRIRGDVNLLLVHANAGLDEEYQSLIVDKPIYDGEGDDETGRVIAQRWFTQQKKQALLAPFGVGTIDQALLSVLQTRHWFVRLFGLSGKAVIFDEVHAYDTYMSEILQRLLTWLAEMRCPVILLSATLPATKRLELAEAYAKGAKATLEAREQELEAQDKPVGYPRLTFVNGEKVEPIAITDTTEPKSVALQFAPPDAASILSSLRANLPDGGCVAVICNTVDRAQKIYEDLRDALKPDGWDVTLFHARTPFVWRQERERATLEAFGKGSGAQGTQLRLKQLIVATAVIEQSLDLDFDFMLSDMAPADLLLQRMGRLHRHKRVRAPDDLQHFVNTQFESRLPARFVVLTDGELAPCIADNGSLSKNAALPTPNGPPPAFSNAGIYDRYVLLRSWLAIRCKQSITLPSDIQPLVEEVYDQPESAPSSAAWLTALETALEDQNEQRRKDKNVAKRRLVPKPLEPQTLLEELDLYLYDDDDPNIHSALRAATRLTEPSIQIACLGRATDAGLPALPNDKDLANAANEITRYAITLQSRRLFHILCTISPPPTWNKNAYLRYMRPLIFEEGTTQVGKYTIRISKELGLVIE